MGGQKSIISELVKSTVATELVTNVLGEVKRKKKHLTYNFNLVNNPSLKQQHYNIKQLDNDRQQSIGQSTIERY